MQDDSLEEGSRASPLFWLIPSFGTGFAALILWLTMTTQHPKLFLATDGDVGRHIRVGEWILQHGEIPKIDYFSYTMRDKPFVPYEWVSEVTYALAHRMLGLAGAALLAGALFTLACWMVYRTAVQLGAGTVVALFAAIYGSVLQYLHLLARPHLFTTALTALFFALLWRYRTSGTRTHLWALPLLMVVWANVHGGFLVGFILIAIFWVDAFVTAWRSSAVDRHSRWKNLILVGLLALAASCVNPAGPELWSHCIGYLRTKFLVDATLEYRSPDFHQWDFQIFLGGILAVVLLLLIRRVSISLVEGLLLLFWLSSSLYSLRNIPLFSVIVVPMMARWTSDTLRSFADRLGALQRFVSWEMRVGQVDVLCRKPVMPVVLLAGAILWTVAHRDSSGFRFSERTFPVQALAKARQEGLVGRIFNEAVWGGYLLYAAPEIPVFIDGQTDFYGEQHTRDYITLLNVQPGWRELLERHHIDWTLTGSDAPLNQALALLPEWRQVHKDETATIFVRR